MRILMVSDFYAPAIGGVEQHVRGLAKALVRRGHEVAVATLRFGDTAARDDDDGVDIYRLRGTAQRAGRLFASDRRPWAPPGPDPELALSIHRLLASFRPQIVHGHDWLARSYLPERGRFGESYVQTLHYYTQSCAKKSLMREAGPCPGPEWRACIACSSAHYGRTKGPAVAIANRGGAWLERRAADRTIVVSEATAQGNGLDRLRDRYVVIPNFVPATRDAVPNAERLLLDQLPVEPFALFVGDLRRDKGLDVLLAAYGHLRQPLPLVLIGKRWPETPPMMPPGVRVLEDWPNAAVLAAWERALFGIVPSVWPEPFGIVAIEALSAGRPVVASSTGGLPEIIEHGRSGLLVPPGDAEALADAMHRLVAEPALRERLGAGALERSAAFGEQRIVDAIEELYFDSVAERHLRSATADLVRETQ